MLQQKLIHLQNNMDTKRAIQFGVMYYVASFILYAIMYQFSYFEAHSTAALIVFILINIPLLLLFAKWYFKADTPTAKKGFLIGVAALVIGALLDYVLYYAGLQPTDRPFGIEITSFYMSPVVWGMLVGFLLLTTYAGYEFDATYTKKD